MYVGVCLCIWDSACFSFFIFFFLLFLQLDVAVWRERRSIEMLSGHRRDKCKRRRQVRDGVQRYELRDQHGIGNVGEVHGECLRESNIDEHREHPLWSRRLLLGQGKNNTVH